MSKQKLILHSILHAVGVAIYVFLVVLFMSNAEHLFDGVNQKVLGPMVMLLLLVISAAVMGILVFGRPVMMYLDNKKKEALQMLFYTVGWVVVIFVVLLAILFIL